MSENVMRKLFVSVALVAAIASAAASAEERGAWFREARFGMFIHWGLYSVPAKGEWIYARHPWKKGEYEALAKTWNPTNYNPREWARLAKRAGMKYAVFTTRHHDGFCMFDSHFTDYKITNTPYGRDAVREYVEAFRAEGLRVGFYHSLPDWTHPGYSDQESPDGIQGRPLHTPTPEEYAAFKELVANHVRQLMTEYGKIDLLFLDYTSKYKKDVDYFDRERLLKIAYDSQPGIIVNDRLSFWKENVRDFDYYTPEICIPSEPLRVKGQEVPWETCATINGSWGYCADDNAWKSPEALVAGLVGCVSRNGNLLLNVGPMADGSLPAPAVERLNALGDWYAANAESATGCGKSSFTPPFGCAYTQKGNALYCHFLQQPLGDVILPGLKGKIDKVTLLRTGEAVECVDQWGFELLKPDDQRIRPKGIVPGDVVKIVLSVQPFPEFAKPRAVTRGPHDHFLANYFAINSWSPDNRYILALETDIKDKLPDGAPCTVGLVDTGDGDRFIPVMETRTWNFQEAAMAHWLPNEKDTFVVNDLRDGKFVAVVRNWRTGAERIVPHPVSAVSEDGTWALSINYARLYLTRPDYGYAGEGQDPRRGVVFPEDDGLWRVDLKTGAAKLLVSCAALKAMVPQVPDTGLSYICHTVISKDMKRVYFLSRSVSQSMEGVKKFSGVNWHTTAFTCDADGTNIRRCFPDGWGSSHFNWKPALSERDARTMIVTCKWQNKVYTHVEFTVGEEDNAHQVGGDEMNFDGHCIYTPDGKFISGDDYWDESFFRHWKMVRLSDDAVKDLGEFYVPEKYRDIYCRCDLHPRWRPDGGQLGFNSVHEGSRQIYVMDVVKNAPRRRIPNVRGE